ncbi:trihelix transcription factor GTL1-like [Photinus pyralis]|nr:trihelix transcription factor GTL1-like [Photinus pyralis]
MNRVLARCEICDFISYENIVNEHIRTTHAPDLESRESTEVENWQQEDITLNNEDYYEDHDYGVSQEQETPIVTQRSQASASEPQNHHWQDNEIKLLISLYEEHKTRFEDKSTTNRKVWQQIAELMNANGYMVTWEQCENKFKNLKKQYKKVIDHNAATGRNRLQFKYFDIMDNLLHQNPEINPPAECSSLNVEPECPNSPINDSGRSTPSCSTQLRPNNKRKNKENEPVWFKKFREDMDKRHQEKMKMQERLINVIEKHLNT